MVRTDKSVLQRYEEAEWTYDRSTQVASGPTSTNWGEILRANILTTPTQNKVTVTYIVKNGSGTSVGAGYVSMDYRQTSALGIKPTVSLTNKVTDGIGSVLKWVVDYRNITSSANRLSLMVNVEQSGLSVHYKVEASSISAISNINDNIGFSIWAIPSDATIQVLVGNRFWERNDSGDVYNTNYGGRIGVNTGRTIDSNVILDVNGNVAIRGDIRIKKDDSDHIIIDSDSNLGYLFGISNATAGVPVFFIDNNNQVGVNTNMPENMLHVVGNAQITDRVSIGSGDSPEAKVHVTGEGNTYATMSLYMVNSDGKDLFRVHDDGTVWMSNAVKSSPAEGKLNFGNGISGGFYDTTADVTIRLGYLIASPTGAIYVP